MVGKGNVAYKDYFKKKAPQRAEHLKKYQFKKGDIPNPTGRTAGKISLVDTLKKYLRRHPEELENIVLALVKEGRLGNMVATKELLDRLDGKVVERHKIEGEMPIRILFVPAQELLDNKEPAIEGEEARELTEGESEKQSAG